MDHLEQEDWHDVPPEPGSLEQTLSRLNLHNLYPKLRRVAADTGSAEPASTSSTTDTHHLQTARATLSTSTEDVYASLNGFQGFYNLGTMREQLKKMETRFNALAGSAFPRPAHRPRTDPATDPAAGSRDPYAAYDPRLHPVVRHEVPPEPDSLEQTLRSLNLYNLYPKPWQVAVDTGSAEPASTTSTTDTHHLQAGSATLSTSTEDVRASMNRFWESSDSGTMDEYLNKLKASIERYNVLDGSAYGRPSADVEQRYAAYDPYPHTHYRPPPVHTDWPGDTHAHSTVARQKTQAWHVVVIVLIVLAALFSYACKLSAKRDRSNSDRQRSASNCTSSTPATRRAQAHDPIPSAPLRDPLRSLPPQHPPLLLPAAESDDLLQGDVAGVMVERSEFHILAVDTDVEMTPPSQRRAATPPPPYPGLPIHTYTHSNDGQCKEEEDPPPPYQAAIVKKPA